MTAAPPMALGDSLTGSRTITDRDIEVCAELTGDFGAHHVAGLRGRKMAQGLLTVTAAPWLDGDGVHVTAMDLRFLAPVYAGDTITASVTVAGLAERPDGGVTVEFAMTVANSGGEVIRGTGTADVDPSARIGRAEPNP